MAIITISRGSFSHGKEVAEKLAAKLGYECVSREVILKASKHFNIPENEMLSAVHDAPSVLERFSYGKERHIAFFREALMHYLQRDNVVYHGLAGHFFVQEIAHALKVRIIADLEDRVAEQMRREGVSAEAARKTLIEDDKARLRWSQYLYGIDTSDQSLYDLIIRVKCMSTDDAAEIISQAGRLPCFQTTPESRDAMHMLFTAAQVQAALVEEIPSIQATVENGEIVVTTSEGYWAEGKKMIAKVDRIVDSEKGGVKLKVRLTSR
jgi:cytidylate kinase